jgi:arginyl-tRNA synthetase
MKNTILNILRDALSDLGVEPPAFIEIETPREESFGDLSTPVAMGLAGTLRKSPKAIAQEIADSIREQDMFEGIQVAGPGYINFTFSLDFITRSLRSLLEEGPSFLRTDVGGGRKVQVEFVSANPTGPLHLGHGRGAAVGCALANLLEAAGYEVAREYYVNDAGRQVFLLGESVFSRYQGLLHEEYPLPEEGYRGAYVEEIARAALEDVGEKYRGSSFADAREHFVDFSLSMMLGEIRQDLEDFGVRFDTWQSERQLYESGTVAHAINYLRERNLIYESDGAIWFGAMEFGDTKDRVVIKSDGQHTYFASDIAYHLKKVEGGYEEIINIWGADHHGYVPRLEAVIEALGSEREKLTVLLVQMVSLLRAGEPVQMSKTVTFPSTSRQQRPRPRKTRSSMCNTQTRASTASSTMRRNREWERKTSSGPTSPSSTRRKKCGSSRSCFSTP